MRVAVGLLSHDALDWAVASCENIGQAYLDNFTWRTSDEDNYSTNWSLGGPIIDREGISTALRYTSVPAKALHDVWDAIINPEFYSAGRPGSGVKKEVIATGPTPLVAAMRCYVASKFGSEVDIPEELL